MAGRPSRVTSAAAPLALHAADDAFASATFDAFDRASAASTAPPDQLLELAGRGVRVRYVGSQMAERFRPALACLARTHEHVDDFEICCWDRSTTDVVPPPPPWPIDDHLASGRIRGRADGALRATFDAGARILFLYDRDRHAALLHAASADGVPAWMDRAPFRALLTWWAADRGLALLHASAVATEQGAVVFAGTSGAGKSTTALACVAAGFRFVGDDACLVSAGTGPVAHSIYGLAKLEPDALRRFPALAQLPHHVDAGQLLVEPGARTCRRAPLRAVVLPRVAADGSTSMTPVDTADAMRTLVPTTLLEGGGVVRGSLGTLADVARRVPCHRLDLGGDVRDAVDAVRDLLAGRP